MHSICICISGGFLGLLHMDVCQTRLEREFDLDLICTAPSVVYQVCYVHMCMLYICACYTYNMQCVCYTCVHIISYIFTYDMYILYYTYVHMCMLYIKYICTAPSVVYQVSYILASYIHMCMLYICVDIIHIRCNVYLVHMCMLNKSLCMHVICTAPSVVYQVSYIHVCMLYICTCYTCVYIVYI